MGFTLLPQSESDPTSHFTPPFKVRCLINLGRKRPNCTLTSNTEFSLIESIDANLLFLDIINVLILINTFN